MDFVLSTIVLTPFHVLTQIRHPIMCVIVKQDIQVKIVIQVSKNQKNLMQWI
jgi:hypothetical protein